MSATNQTVNIKDVCILVASHRADSQSHRIGDHLKSRFLEGQASMIDLNEDRLPMWDGSDPSEQPDANGESPAEVVERVKKTAEKASSFVFVVPEWHGMAPAGLKNFFLWVGARELAHKPALLVTVSAGTGGAMVVNELRANSYKNSRLNFIPEQLIFRDVNHLWADIQDRESDDYLAKRTGCALNLLRLYTEALTPVRSQLTASLQDYPNGMS